MGLNHAPERMTVEVGTLILWHMTVYKVGRTQPDSENIAHYGHGTRNEESKIKQLLMTQCHWLGIFCFHEIASTP